jgi:hypothetical protein
MAQDNSDRSDTSSSQNASWFSRMWSSGDKTASAKTTPAPKKSEPPNLEPPSSRRAREVVNLDRRNKVILKLREIAESTGDDALLKKTDELQDRAWELYLQKTSNVYGTLQEARK